MVKNIVMVISVMALGAFMSSEVEAGKGKQDLGTPEQESKTKKRKIKKALHTPLAVREGNTPGAPVKPKYGAISKAPAGIRRAKKGIDFHDVAENDPIWDESVTEQGE